MIVYRCTSWWKSVGPSIRTVKRTRCRASRLVFLPPYWGEKKRSYFSHRSSDQKCRWQPISTKTIESKRANLENWINSLYKRYTEHNLIPALSFYHRKTKIILHAKKSGAYVWFNKAIRAPQGYAVYFAKFCAKISCQRVFGSFWIALASLRAQTAQANFSMALVRL